MIYAEHLGLGQDASGETVWFCRHCNQPADHAEGLQGNPDQLVYMLMCPRGEVTLGEWATLEEKEAQLAAYLAKLA
jgi:hypothetical protein